MQFTPGAGKPQDYLQPVVSLVGSKHLDLRCFTFNIYFEAVVFSVGIGELQCVRVIVSSLVTLIKSLVP